MKTIGGYLSELKSYFSDSNMHVYKELEEDLLEEIQNSMAEGQTEEQAVSKLSQPADVASDLFADRRSEMVNLAEGDVVPEEDVAQLFKEARRKRFSYLFQKSLVIMKYTCLLALLSVGVFFVVYTFQEYYYEKHLARIPMIFLCMLPMLFMGLWPQKRWQRKKQWLLVGMLSVVSLGLLIESVAREQLIYQGVPHYQEITADGVDDLSFIFNSNADIEVTTSEVGAKDQFRVLFNGNFRKQDIKAITKNDGKKDINLQINQANAFNLFTWTKKSQIIVLIPKGTKLTTFQLTSLDGDLRLLNFSAESLKLNVSSGDIFGKGLEVEQVDIASQDGDIVFEDSRVSGRLVNAEGKTVLTRLTGDLAVTGTHNQTIIKNQTSKESRVDTQDGKIIITDSKIDKLVSVAETGQSVITNTIGNMTVESVRGKIVLESNQGQLLSRNEQGVTIVIDTENMPSQVTSDSGFIKWIHDEKNTANFHVRSQKGNVRNEFPLAEKKGAAISIDSVSGDIRVIKKVE